MSDETTAPEENEETPADETTDDTPTEDTGEDSTQASGGSFGDDSSSDSEITPYTGDEKDAAFVVSVVKQIVENPDDVVVGREVDEMGVLITLKVNKDDMGKIIGKDGQTAKAIRTLLRIIGSKNNARVNLKIVEPAGA